MEEPRLGVREVDREHLPEALGAFLVVLPLEGDTSEEIVRLGLDFSVGLAEPVFKRRFRRRSVPGLDHQVDGAEHGASRGRCLGVRRVVADGLVLELHRLEVLLVAERLGTDEDHRGGDFGSQLRLVVEELGGERAGAYQHRVLLAAHEAHLVDRPGGEGRRQLRSVTLELPQMRGQKLGRALEVVAHELVGGNVERIEGIVLGNGIDARQMGRRLGAEARRHVKDLLVVVARNCAYEKVDRLPHLLGARPIEDVHDGIVPDSMAGDGAAERMGDLCKENGVCRRKPLAVDMFVIGNPAAAGPVVPAPAAGVLEAHHLAEELVDD